MTPGKIDKSWRVHRIVVNVLIAWFSCALGAQAAGRGGAGGRAALRCLPQRCARSATFYPRMLGSCLFRSSRLEFVEGSPLPVADVLWHVSGGTCTAYKAINQSSHSNPPVGRNLLAVRGDVSEEARLYSRNNRENSSTQKSLIDIVNCPFFKPTSRISLEKSFCLFNGQMWCSFNESAPYIDDEPVGQLALSLTYPQSFVWKFCSQIHIEMITVYLFSINSNTILDQKCYFP